MMRIGGSLLRRSKTTADAVILGFPKCGNTWFQYMVRVYLATALQARDAQGQGLFVSDTPKDPAFAGLYPKILATHNMPRLHDETAAEMMLDCTAFLRKNVVILVRDPRDALVSAFFHQKLRSQKKPFAGDIADFVRSEIYGVAKFVAFYTQLERDLYRFGRYRIVWDEAPPLPPVFEPA